MNAIPRPIAKPALIGSALALLAGTLWSFGGLAVRFSPHADPWQYLMWRGVGLTLFLELANLIQGKGLQIVRIGRLDRLSWLASASLVLASVSFVYALKTTTVANAVFFSSTSPLLTAVIARFVLGERIGVAGGVAIALGLAGLAVMVGGNLEPGDLYGNAAGLLSAFGFAFYTVCIRIGHARDWTPALVGYGLLTAVTCLVATLVLGNPLILPAQDTAFALSHGAILIGFGTIAFNRAGRTVPAVSLTVLAQTETLFAPLWAYLVLAEVPRTASLIGGLLIFAAILVKALTAQTPPPPRADGG